MNLTWANAVPIQTVPFLALVYTLAALPALVLLTPRFGLTGRIRVRAAWSALGLGLGTVAGWLVVWQMVDIRDAFGAPASDIVRGAVCGAGAVVGLAIANLVRSSYWRKAIALVAVLTALPAAALMVNRDVAYFPTLGDALGDTGVHRLVVDDRKSPSSDTEPTVGRLGTVRIPAPASGFQARDAWVYLPPAALVPHPIPLPVMIAMSGEPGGPSDVFVAGGLKPYLDSIAAEHGGVAPIVVVPDQLGGYARNPMCVDSAMGRVKTYVTVDVRRWILQHLPAATDRTRWAIAGFSEGGTCAAQFGTAHPELFGSFVAVSPEWGPLDHSPARSIREAFHGDRAAWRAAFPIATMRDHGRYRDLTAVYAVGALDRRYGLVAPAMAKESRRVGMDMVLTRIPGLAHNWNTGAAGLEFGVRTLLPRWGIQ